MYCLDCMNGALCTYCLVLHREHHVIQVRRPLILFIDLLNQNFQVSVLWLVSFHGFWFHLIACVVRIREKKIFWHLWSYGKQIHKGLLLQ